MIGNPTYCFIINCASNSEKAESFFRSKQNVLANIFPDSSFIYITKDDSIKDIVRIKSNSFSHIIACGGDGTVNQVAQALYNTDSILGVLPLGSGNDIAQSTGIPLNFEEAVDVLRSGNIQYLDVIIFENKLIVNTCGIGVDGLTNYYASQKTYKTGFIRYFVSGLKALRTANIFTISFSLPESDTTEFRKVWMAVIANGPTEGGSYRISPASKNFDGIGELILVKDISRFRLCIEFLKLSMGLPFNNQVVETHAFSKSVSIQVDKNQKIHMDGENVIFGENPTEFQLLRGAIKVLAP